MTTSADYDVIVVDDEPSVTQIFQQYILWKYKSWRFSTFNNPSELYEALTRYEYYAKVWILDIMMPRKNGVEIAAAIRRFYGDSPVILAFTALDRRVFETDENYKYGVAYFNHFINKREEFSSILSLVDVWVQKAK